MGQRFIAIVVVLASACTALHFSATAQESVVVSNNPYVFPAGGGSAPFTISAAGSGDDDQLISVTLSNCNSQWSLWLPPTETFPVHICGGGAMLVNPGSGSTTVCPHSYTFYANFTPSQPGVSSCNVQIVTMPTLGSGSDTQFLMLSGSGSGGSGISVAPQMIDFGDQQLNVASMPPVPVTVKNLGSAGVSVTGVLTGPAFQVSGGYQSFSLGGNGSASFNVTCTPPALGPQSGSLTFTAGSSVQAVSLSCNGINSTVNIAPSQVNFDSTLVGRAPPSKSVTITGAATATIDMVSLDSTATTNGVTISSNPQGQMVGTGKSIVLDYAAADMHASGPLGVLTIKVSTDANSRNVSISGEALKGGVGTNPPNIEFGAVCAGSKLMKDVEVYASEAGDVQMMSVTPPAAPFQAMAVESLPKTLMGNHAGPSVTVRSQLMPTVPGEFGDAFAVMSNVPGMPETVVQLHGTALAEGIAATPNQVHFGSAPAGATTSIKEVQFTNCGTKDLMFDAATITGDNAAEFTLIGANPPRVIKPTESEVFMVVMQPESSGYKTAQLVITHADGTTVADLDGTGEGANKERETYYACSTGCPVGIAPIAFALLLVRRRCRN